MHKDRVAAVRSRGRLSREDEDILACQILSAFLWVLFILMINFFFLHRSNSIPEAEAMVSPPPEVVQAPELPRPLPELAMLPQTRPLPRKREIFEDDYKPNYYFLFQDQIRFVDSVPEPKVMVASTKTTVPVPEVPEKEEIIEEVLEAPPPKPKPVPVEWVDMAMMEPEKPREQEPEEPPREKPEQRAIQVAMVSDADLDLEIVTDAPEPLATPPPEPKPVEPVQRMRVSAVDLDLEIVEEAPVTPAPTAVAAPVAHTPKKVVAPRSADFVSLSMEIAPEVKTATGTGAKTQAPPARRPVLVAKAAPGPVADVPMALEFGEKPSRGSRSAPAGPIKQKTKAAKLVPMSGRGVGDIEMPMGILGGEGEPGGRGRGQGTAVASVQPSTPAHMLYHRGAGSITLGQPLAFGLAQVEDETHTGSAYLRKSTRLKRMLEQRRLPTTPVTVSLDKEAVGGPGGRLAAISYSRSQVVLQYADGKQQVVMLVEGEPYPRFELRKAVGSETGAMKVGSKLEEITGCLSTLQHFWKE